MELWLEKFTAQSNSPQEENSPRSFHGNDEKKHPCIDPAKSSLQWHIVQD